MNKNNRNDLKIEITLDYDFGNTFIFLLMRYNRRAVFLIMIKYKRNVAQIFEAMLCKIKIFIEII